MNDFQPDTPIAETYIWRNGRLIRVYTFERSSSAADYGLRRFHETHIHYWDDDPAARMMLAQIFGHGIDFHCDVVAAVQRDGENARINQFTTAGAARAWRKMAEQLYAAEVVEAVKPFCVPYKGPRRDIPEGFVEVSNDAGVDAETWYDLVYKTSGEMEIVQ